MDKNVVHYFLCFAEVSGARLEAGPPFVATHGLTECKKEWFLLGHFSKGYFHPLSLPFLFAISCFPFTR